MAKGRYLRNDWSTLYTSGFCSRIPFTVANGLVWLFTGGWVASYLIDSLCVSSASATSSISTAISEGKRLNCSDRSILWEDICRCNQWDNNIWFWLDMVFGFSLLLSFVSRLLLIDKVISIYRQDFHVFVIMIPSRRSV